GFLANNAGFDVSQSLIPYSGSDPYTRVFLVGLLNTLLVSVIGIFFATLIGFIVALGRLSPNWLLSRISGGYVELIRNLPVLFQILFWYLAVLAALPNPRQSISIFDSFFLSNRGLVIPKPIGEPGFEPFVAALLIAIVAAIALWRYARQQLFQSGKVIKVWPYALGLLIGQALLVSLPPLTNQYLNLTKNYSLAVAIGYPDLVSVFAGTTLSQTGQAIEIIGITMGVYLLISLVTSAVMSFYGWRISRSMGA